MTYNEVMAALEGYGSETTKNTLVKHGAKEPFFGVKVQDLKKILKKTKKNHALSLELYDSGNTDAMYLAGLMADEKQITKKHLNDWVKKAYWSYLSEYTVPWVASETPYGFELGLKWRTSKEETIASAGWATLASCASVRDDAELDIPKYKALLDEIPKEILTAKNRVKYTMNGFVIATGSYIKELNGHAMKIGKEIGKVEVDMKGTACKIPLATTYIQKVMDKNKVGNKRKSARC